MQTPREVIKRDGRVVAFDSNRILEAIRKAVRATRGREPRESAEVKEAADLPQKVLERVLSRLAESYGVEGGALPNVEIIQNIVEQSLMEFGLYDVAKAYVLYRREREKVREEKKRILEKDYVDDVDKNFSLNAIRLLASRYLLRDEAGKIIEGPKQMFQRTAALVTIADILHDPRIFNKQGNERKWKNPQDLDYDRLLQKTPGLGKNGSAYDVRFNRFHIERMCELYRELNEQGMMISSWEKFLDILAGGEFDNHYVQYLEYYEMMTRKEFLPNSPTLFNAGARLGQLSACFVIPIEDNMVSIMKSASDCALIFQSGGGVGINYSALRPEGDIVASTGGIASGPVTFMRIVDTVTDVVKQGGKRRGANMGILEISHPDIEKFIKSKHGTGLFENFNISVLIDPEFWDHFEKGEAWPLKNPRNGASWGVKDPRQLFTEIATEAWNNADPGVVFLDGINSSNPLRDFLGEIRCTNPCGEQPMYPYESCNLGSINLYAFVRFDAAAEEDQESGAERTGAEDGETSSREKEKRKVHLDWDRLAKAIKVGTRFLDDVIDVNRFPIKEIARVSKQTRRIGLGLMGLADTLYALGIPYNSEEGFALMSKIGEFFAFNSIEASLELATERGPFPLFEKSTYSEGKLPFDAFRSRKEWTMDWQSLSSRVQKDGIRNSHTLTIAPTGSISMIADVSSGLEPQFALVFEKHVTVGSFYYTDPELERQLTEMGGMHEDLLKKISENGGSLQEGRIRDDDERLESTNGLLAAYESEGVEKLRNVFLVAYDIPWWDHVRAQMEMQKWISASVSKTINMPSWVTIADVEKAYLFAHRLGLKGITIYRDGSKGEQVLRTPSQRQNRYVSPVRNRTLEIMSEIGIELPHEQQALSPIQVTNTAMQEQLGAQEERQQQIFSMPILSGRSTTRCPSCGGTNIVWQEACRKCLDCGWSTCTVA